MTTKIAVKSRLTGELVGMATLDKDCDGPLDALQRTTDEEMRGHVVSYATAQEVSAFEASRRRVN